MFQPAARFGLGLLLMTSAAHQSYAEKAAAGRQVEQALELEEGSVKQVPYLLYLPQGYGQEQGKKWPLVLFLHGRGESYGPLSLVTKWGLPKMVKEGHDLPYILVSPQCPGDNSWNQPGQQGALIKLLDSIGSTCAVDSNRVYLTGLSMGGYGSWRLAADHPGRFAAVVPICGGGRTEDAERLKDIPIWVWHGDQDRAVDFQHSKEMVAAIRKAGGQKIKFTTLEGIGHNSWSAAYATPELYRWLSQQALASGSKE